MKQTESKRILLSVLGVAILIVAVVGISYAVFVFTSNSTKENKINTGTISMSYTEGITSVMTITNAMPTEDSVGKTQSDKFDFQISASIAGVTKINYQITAKNLTGDLENGQPKIPVANQLNGNQVKIYLEKENSTTGSEVLSPTIFSDLKNASQDDLNTKVLYNGSFSNTTSGSVNLSDKFALRMWLDSNAPIDEISRTFKIRVDVKAITE